MGIPNLLPFVKKACRQGNISELSHQSVGVDVSCLLHRGLIGCADKVAHGSETDFYIRYVMKYVKALLANDCHVILVFDGQPLPAKKETNSSRREKRNFHMQRGDLLMSQGRASEAYDCFKRGAALTTDVIESTVQAFRHLNMVDVIVAPYESDAQLAFLAKGKLVQAVVTEDSDLIAFGCEKIVFKMDPMGSCVIFEQNLLPKCLCRALAENFDFNKFRRICILSGCDYLQAGLPGIGLNKAATFFAKTSGKNLYQVLPRLPRYLNMNSLKITKQFISDFIRAENTFLYQIVFDPIERRQRPLHDYPLSQNISENGSDFQCSSQGSDNDLSYAGEIQSPEVATSLALGNIPGGSQTEKIHLPLDVPDWSIWSSKYKSKEKQQNKELAEEIKKSCGAFTLMLSKSSSKKIAEHRTKTSRPRSLHVLNTTSREQPIVAASSTNDNDGFVTLENIKDLKPLTETLKINEVSEKNDSKVTSCRTIGVLRNGNGARQNWNCDQLLKEFAVPGDTPLRIASKFQLAVVDEIPVKKARCVFDGGRVDDDMGLSSITSVVKKVRTATTTVNNAICSKYFANKGSKTSGLSRRSVPSVRIEPCASQPAFKPECGSL